MPYEAAKTKALLPIVSAFAAQPGGDFIRQLADQLLAAEEEMKNSRNAVGDSERALNKATADLESAQQTIVRLRNGVSGNAEMMTALQLIAKSSRGAQKIAQEALDKITAPANAEAGKS